MKAIQAVRLEVFDYLNDYNGRGFLYYKAVKEKLQQQLPGPDSDSLPELLTNQDVDHLEYEQAKQVGRLIKAIKDLLNIEILEKLVEESQQTEATVQAWIMGMK